ncbi:MAG: hypothetical protein IT288_12300 [Bdellovibrionales bacterium]|nr:hypothetical protein [Bdellovibrionales bacterium]
MIRSLVHKMNEISRANGGGAIALVKIRIGALANISATHFREHFEIETVGTIAEGATLEVEEHQDPSDPHAAEIVLESVEVELK